MVDDQNQDLITDVLGKIIFKIDVASQLLVDGKVIPAHAKMVGIRHILTNLRLDIMKRGKDGETKSTE